MTFSLVACDREAGQWGVVVASKFLAVGAVVPWARADVGAVATQAFANLTYGPDGLDLLAAGASAQETIDRLTAADAEFEQRQIGVVDAAGGSASFSGSGCFTWAGGRTGDGYAAQGNLLAGPQVVAALADTFEATEGPLVERMLAALQAAGDEAGRRPPRPPVGGGDRAPDGRRLRRQQRPPDRPARRRPPRSRDRAAAPVRDPGPAVRAHAGGELIPLEQVQAEVSDLLGRVGYGGELEPGLREWAGMENLEERLYDGRIDPVVLRALREQRRGGLAER